MTVTGYLRLEGLTRRFGPQFALDTLSLQVPRGDMLALLGPSGSGKTTTLRLLAGFETPDAGRIIVDGEDVTATPPAARRFGMVFQHYALFPHLDVGRNVAFGLESLGVPPEERTRRVREALEMVELAGLERRPVSALSGDSSSAWRWPARWRRSRACCCSTSRSPTSIPPSASEPGASSAR